MKYTTAIPRNTDSCLILSQISVFGGIAGICRTEFQTQVGRSGCVRERSVRNNLYAYRKDSRGVGDDARSLKKNKTEKSVKFLAYFKCMAYFCNAFKPKWALKGNYN